VIYQATMDVDFRFTPLIERFSKIKEKYGDEYPIILYEPKIQCQEKKVLKDLLQGNSSIHSSREFKEAFRFAESLGTSFLLIVPDDFEEKHVLRNFGGLANTCGRAMFDFEEEALFKSLFQGIGGDLIKSFELKAYVFITMMDFIIDAPVNEKEEVMMMNDIRDMAKEFQQEFTVMWCDPKVNCESKQKLEKEIEMHIKESNVFLDSSELYQNIKSYAGTPYHLILSGKDSSAEKLIKEIDNLKGLLGLYIYGDSPVKIPDERVEIQSTLEELIPKIKEGFRTKSKLVNTFPSFATNFDAVDKSHIYNVHYYLKGLIHFNNRRQAKEDFVKLARKIYQDQERLLERFENEYEEYNGERILRWYTKDSPVYKLVNNCLRISSSDSILYGRFVLRDMEQAIKDQYRHYCKDFNGLVYRGAYISSEEWEKLERNIGQEIEMYGFLSTTVCQRTAVNFFRGDPKNKIFITIIVPPLPELYEQGFANVSQFSAFKGESEILFNVRSRFRILEARITKIDDRGIKGRHLVLLYGAPVLRRYMTKRQPITDLKFKFPSDVKCKMCGCDDKLFGFHQEEGTEIRCIDCLIKGFIPKDTPLIALDFEKGGQEGENPTKNFQGQLRVFNQGMSFPYYGYRCNSCEVMGKDKYYKWIDSKTGKSFEQCSDCFKSRRKIEGGGILIAESNPYVIWQEHQTEWEAVDNDHEREISEIVKYEGQGGVYMKVQRFDLCLEFEKKVLTGLARKSRREVAKTQNFFLMGMACERSGKYQQALMYHQMVLEIMKAIFGDISPQTAILYNRLASVEKSLGKYQKALEYNDKALDIRKRVYGDEHSQVAISYTSIASLYRILGNYKDALESHQKALSIRTTIYGDKHQDSAVSYNGLASVYESLGQYQEALDNHIKTLDINIAIYGENHSHVATSYNNLALTYRKLGKVKEALKFQQKTVEIDKIIYGENHPQTAAAYNNLALILKDMGQYQEALEYNKRALEIRQAVYEEGHPDIGLSYNNLASVYQSLGQYHEALGYFTKALDISKMKFGDKHHTVGVLYNNLAEVYRNLRQYPVALEYSQRGLDINTKIYGEKHPQTIISLSNLGSVFQNLGQHQEALQYFAKALEIAKIIHGDKHPQTTIFYNNVALLYKNFGQYEKAREFYEKALENLKTIYGDKHPHTAISYSNLALVYECLNRYEQALEYHKQSLEINQGIFGDKHPETASSYNNIAFAHENLGQFEEALEYYRKVLNIEKPIYGENHPNIAISFNSLALVYESLGQYNEAIEHNNKTLRINLKIYGEKHPHITISYKNLASVYQKMGQHQEALKCHNKIQEINRTIGGHENK